MAESNKLSQPVQELINNGENEEVLLKKYVYKGIDSDTIGVAVPFGDIPVIDLRLLSPFSPTRDEELDKLKSVLVSWGCFQAVNHGMTSLFLDEVREITKQFFAHTVEEKKRCTRQVDDIEGYGTDIVLYEKQILDWADRLYVLVHPADRRRLKFWPETPTHFRETLHEFSTKSNQINEAFLKAMAKSLNLEENCFLRQYGEDKASLYARFNLYPQCPRPDLILALKPHADGSAVTILLQDKEVEGLQFLKDNQWFRVPIIPEAHLINIGDQLEIMSNGIFKSPVHRVVTNSEKQSLCGHFLPSRTGK